MLFVEGTAWDAYSGGGEVGLGGGADDLGGGAVGLGGRGGGAGLWGLGTKFSLFGEVAVEEVEYLGTWLLIIVSMLAVI